MKYILQKSNKPDKKWMVTNEFRKTIHFGSSKHEDYTIHRDEKRKILYLTRHSVREDWTDLSKPGAWSRWILWNLKTLPASVHNMEKKFKIQIIFQKQP